MYRKGNPRHGALLLLCLSFPACQANAPRTLAGSTSSAAFNAPATTGRQAGQPNTHSRAPGRGPEAAAAQAAIEAGRRPQLNTHGDPKGKAKLVARIINGELEALYAPGVSLNLTGIEEASLVYQAGFGQNPSAVSDLAPFCFSWPTVPCDAGQSLVALAASPITPGSAWSLDQASKPGLWLDLAKAGLVAVVPCMLDTAPTNGDRQIYVTLPLAYQIDQTSPANAMRRRVEPGLSRNLATPERNRLLFEYLQRPASNQDLRLRAAQRALSRLIQEAAKRAGALPRSLVDAEKLGGAKMIQVATIPEPEADLVVEFDGVQAYRYTFRLESGTVGQVVSYYFAVHPMDAANVYAPAGQVRESALEWRPFAALKLTDDPPVLHGS